MNRLDQLATLLRFPSISAQKEHAQDVSDCADWLVDKLSGMGLEAAAHKTRLHPIVMAQPAGGRQANRADLRPL